MEVIRFLFSWSYFFKKTLEKFVFSYMCFYGVYCDANVHSITMNSFRENNDLLLFVMLSKVKVH